MPDYSSSEILHRLNKINGSLDLLVKLAALNFAQSGWLESKGTREERIKALIAVDIPEDVIALIVGISPRSLRLIKNQMKKKTEKVSEEPEFRVDDLTDILTNPDLFGSSHDMIEFSNNVLQLKLGPIYEAMKREDIVNCIIRALKESDNIKQALFIQALEQRARSKELKDTRFSKFLDAWEEHIKT